MPVEHSHSSPEGPPQIPTTSVSDVKGPEQVRDAGDSAPESSRSSFSYTRTYFTPATGAQTPDPLLDNKSVFDEHALQASKAITSIIQTTEDRTELDPIGHRYPDAEMNPMKRYRIADPKQSKAVRQSCGVPWLRLHLFQI